MGLSIDCVLIRTGTEFPLSAEENEEHPIQQIHQVLLSWIITAGLGIFILSICVLTWQQDMLNKYDMKKKNFEVKKVLNRIFN